MINIKNIIQNNYATKPSDAEEIFSIISENDDFELNLIGIEIISTAFFNKIFFLIKKELKMNTDEILNRLRISHAQEIHKFAFSAAVDISYNNERNDENE